ncbi:MAG: large adhesin, partial [uncultured bacterium]
MKMKRIKFKKINHVRSGFYGFGSFFILKSGKRKKFFSRSFSSFIVAIFLIGGMTFNSSYALGSSFTFLQTDWSGGQTSNIANHASNQTGWNQYGAKDAAINMSNGGADLQLSLQTNTANIDYNTAENYSQQDATSGTDISGGTALLKAVSASGNDASTKLLLRMNGADGNTTFSDSSSSAKTVTNNGNTQVSTAQSKFGGASGYFNGSSYLSAPYSSDFDPTSGDFTIDFWMHPTSLSGGSQAWTGLVGTSTTTGDNNWCAYFYSSGKIGIGRAGINEILSTSNVITANSWQHIAYVKSGSTTTIYVNGTSVASASTAVWNFPALPLRMGSTNSVNFYGYLDSVRISKGVARWTSNFTPPSMDYGQLTYPTGTSIDADSSSYANTITKYGSASVQNTTTPVGNKTLSFNGTTSYLTIGNTAPVTLGTGNFTIETFFKTSDHSVGGGNSRRIISLGGNSDISPQIYVQNTNDPYPGNLAFVGNASGILVSGKVISDGVWHHVAAVRNSGVTKLYIDGTQYGSNYNDTNNYISSSPVIGRMKVGTGNGFFNGSMAGMRISNIARYTSSFTPPTQAFISDANTNLLLKDSQSYYITTTNTSQINTSNFSSIIGSSITQAAPANTNIKYLLSFDNRSTWKYWNGSSWQTSILANIDTNGMTKAAFEAISESEWSVGGGFTAGTLDVAASLGSTDSTVTPVLDNIQFSYLGNYPSSQALISSVYNTQTVGSNLSKIQWTESLPANTDIQFQIRTSSDGSSWGPWCGPDNSIIGTCDSSAYFTDPNGGETIDDIQKDKSDDQYFQYKVILSSADGQNTPTLSDVSVSYVNISSSSVSTQAVSNITPASAQANGNIADTGNDNPARQIEYGTVSGVYTN